ncbi:MAG: hypothetical protein NTY03_07405 [Candidatus Bathyarchaeota archaeon]|nr:hypothetical protein [Candidatus Bathyarchaeota archaeon]
MWSLISVGQQGPPDNRGFANIQALIPIAVVIAILLVTLIVILLFPRLRSVKASKPLEPEVHRIEEKKAVEKNVEAKATESPLDVTIRLLHDDERRVVEALAKAGGSMLQKDISYDLKLSRVKTHRVLVDLIERGVVKAEKHYNTNMITLSAWLMGGEGERDLASKPAKTD